MAQSGLFIVTEGKILVTPEKELTTIKMFFRTKAEINLASLFF